MFLKFLENQRENFDRIVDRMLADSFPDWFYGLLKECDHLELEIIIGMMWSIWYF